MTQLIIIFLQEMVLNHERKKVLRTETGNRIFSNTQFLFLLPKPETIYFILVLVNPNPELKFLEPVLAKHEPPETGFHGIYRQTLPEFSFPKTVFIINVII